MFSTFDAFQHSERHTISVDEGEITQLILDALSANVDALPDEYAQLTGLERHREFKRVAGDLIEDWKTQKVKISDDEEQEPPYCADCEKEWTVDVPAFRCPVCEGGSVAVVTGNELEVESIDVEEPCIA